MLVKAKSLGQLSLFITVPDRRDVQQELPKCLSAQGHSHRGRGCHRANRAGRLVSPTGCASGWGDPRGAWNIR